jgi:hypothetical protein
MNRIWSIVAACCGLVSLLCFAVFKATPATIDANGFLHEPFGLVPLGYLFALLAVVALGLAWLRRK